MAARAIDALETGNTDVVLRYLQAIAALCWGSETLMDKSRGFGQLLVSTPTKVAGAVSVAPEGATVGGLDCRV